MTIAALPDSVSAAGALLNVFYRVPRAGAVRLSDRGGPFGFDVTVALQIDHLVRVFNCDGIIETGCFLGDTTEYLGRYYRQLPVRTCDIDPAHAAFTRARVRAYGNVAVHTGDSATLLPELIGDLQRPLLYLDAHWNPDWPLAAELRTVATGVVCIDDFAIGHDRFGYDTYDGRPCDAHLVAQELPDLERMWIGNPFADYPLPCLQTGRRTGTGFLTRQLSGTPIESSPMFLPVPLHPVRLPDWSALGRPTEEQA